MLTNIRIRNFKSYRDATLALAPLTVLIGANASGKSNAIEALRLLSWIAQGNRLLSIQHALSQRDRAIRGTVSTLGFQGGEHFTLSAQRALEWNAFEITLGLAEDGDLHIVDERISTPASAVPLYEVVARSGGSGSDLFVAYNNFARGGKKPQVICNDNIAILQQMQTAAQFAVGHGGARVTIPGVCREFQDLLSSILFLDPNPSVMRDYSYKTEHRLSGNGDNLSGVLYNLQKADRPGAEVLDLVRSLPEQNISGLDFIETPRGEVMLQLEETFGGQKRKFDATLLSDGTLRVLSIAAAILSAPEGSLVVVEEVDNGIHPSRAEGILKNISRIAAERDLRVLISTHNPALMDALPDEAVADVVFCYRDPSNGSSRLIRLGDLPDYPLLVAQDTLGHLLTRGAIDRFVKGHRGPDAKRQHAEEWMRRLLAETA